MLKSCCEFCQPLCAQHQSFLTVLCLPSSEDTLPSLSVSPNAIQLFRDHWPRPFSFSCIWKCLLSGWLPPSRWQALIANVSNSSSTPQPSQLTSEVRLFSYHWWRLWPVGPYKFPAVFSWLHPAPLARRWALTWQKKNNQTNQTKTGAVQESCFLVPYMPTGCWHQLC